MNQIPNEVDASAVYTDAFQFVVHESLPYNTTINFHNIKQKNAPQFVGVPGLNQKPIGPGHSWTYRWTATRYGTHWCHAHDKTDMMDDSYGPICIN